jgi:hypothetical protein
MCLYSFVNNNPICYRDPSGKFLNFIFGAVIGAAVDIFTQVVIEGKSFDKIDWVEVGVSAAAGAATSGLSSMVAGKIGGLVTSKVISATAGKILSTGATLTISAAVGTAEEGINAWRKGEEFDVGDAAFAFGKNFGVGVVTHGVTKGISKGFNRVFRRGVQAATEQVDDVVVVSCKPHGGAGHWNSIKAEVERMVDSGDYDRVLMNRSLSMATGGAVRSSLRPDIIGRRISGVFDLIEVRSPGQSGRYLNQKVSDMLGMLGDLAGDRSRVIDFAR